MDTITIKKDNQKDAENYVKFYLHKFNQKNCKYIKNNSSFAHNNKINGDFIIYNNDEVIGGAIGEIIWEWYYLSDFYISDKYRKRGIGKTVIDKIEKFAKEKGAIGVRVDSWSFQAPEFYKKLGYIVWGEFKDCPPETTHYYLYKKF